MSEACGGADPVIVVTLAGSGADLALPPECPGDEGLWWNALALPDWGMRYTYAPPSQWVPGAVLLAAVPDASAVPITVAARSTSVAGLEVQKARLEAALRRWSYTVSIDVDGTSLGSWEALPCIPSWGAVTPQRAGLFVAEASVSIPVNPAGAP